MLEVKVCGVRCAEDFALLKGRGIDYAGFVFYKLSPRYLSPEDAQGFLRADKCGIKRVGVFVNEEANRIRDVYHQLDLDIVQLHGDESPEYCHDLGLTCWKAVRIFDSDSLDLISQYTEFRVLIDRGDPKLYGGTGERISYRLVRRALQIRGDLIVAGGITADQLPFLIHSGVRAVDVSSALESAPGKKDPRLVADFLDRIALMRGK